MARRGRIRLRGYKPLPRVKGKPRRVRTPSGKTISEYEYRSRKARKAGFRNYTQQRRVRESQDFRKLRFDILDSDPDADLSPGSDYERLVAGTMRRQQKGLGLTDEGPDAELREYLTAIGAPDWLFWRIWYSETKVG